MKCPFCNIRNDEGQSIVLANKHCFFIQKESEQGVLEGSGLIIPKAPRKSVFELTREEWNATYDLLQEVKALLDRKYTPDGYSLGWNVGSASGQEIDHAHFHVIPRYADEPFAGKGIRFWLKQEENRRPQRHRTKR